MFIRTNIQNIVAETDKAVLIKVEKSDFKFWIARKMVRTFPDWRCEVLVPDTWTIKIFREGKNRKILEQREIGADELASMYDESKIKVQRVKMGSVSVLVGKKGDQE